jgi:PHS family inorganic phosphate transporter-like MFS transporter
MSFDTEHKTIQMEEAMSHDQLALEALERRRVALEEVIINYLIYKYIY